ncbi:hypothetical protein RJT34_25323 [Clitoria ternatea]|uniref:BHLH domain-containing protein n=1 Tax=Clitoria ternatea TaxID=43366 RepID=A0AAN9FSA9_CLITE
MEPSQLICEEWSSLSGLHTAEEADFMAQLLCDNYSVTEKHCGNTSFGMPPVFWSDHESTTVTMTDTNSNSYFPSNVTNANFLCFSQGSSSSTCSGNNIFSTTSSGTTLSPRGFQWNDNLSQQISESTDEESSLDPGKLILADNTLQTNRECEMMVYEPVDEDTSRNLENPAKRFRSPIEVSKTLKNAKSRKTSKSVTKSNGEDDSNLSLERLDPIDHASPNLYGKSKANCGPATDPQSLYARKRRERINERLRILQKLVPNGTKVDISTMLEEAVQYVKFLQLQIKLLSSDDLWMYAPIVYNGINIGLDLSISPTKGR